MTNTNKKRIPVTHMYAEKVATLELEDNFKDLITPQHKWVASGNFNSRNEFVIKELTLIPQEGAKLSMKKRYKVIKAGKFREFER